MKRALKWTAYKQHCSPLKEAAADESHHGTNLLLFFTI